MNYSEKGLLQYNWNRFRFTRNIKYNYIFPTCRGYGISRRNIINYIIIYISLIQVILHKRNICNVYVDFVSLIIVIKFLRHDRSVGTRKAEFAFLITDNYDWQIGSKI